MSNPFLKNTSSSGSNPFLKNSGKASTSSSSSNPFLKSGGTSSPSTSTNVGTSNPFLKSKTTTTTSPSSTTSNPFLKNTTSPSLKPHSSNNSPNPSTGEGLYKIKYEQELKKNQELRTEIENLKRRLANPNAPPISVEEAKQKRLTRMQRQTQRLTMNMGNTLDSVIKQIGGLDRRIRAAEAARLQAEDNLMEIAIAKIEVDEVIQKVDTVLKKIVGQIEKFTIPQVREMLMKVRTQTAPEEELNSTGGNRANCRFTIIMPKDSLILPDAPPPPPIAPEFNNNNNNFGPVTNSSSYERGGLLSQIRAGTTLKNIDIKKLKEEQTKHREDAKETMNNMKSLEDTLREALTSKMLNVLAENEEEDDWDDDW